MKKKTNLNLIGISGLIGSGKDTFANMIQAHVILSKDPGFFTVPIDNSIDPVTNYFPMHDVISILKLPTLPFGLDNASGWETKRFATKLKQVVSMFTGIPAAQLERQEVKDMILGPEWAKLITPPTGNGGWSMGARSKISETKPMRVRDILQILGTDALRNILHPDVHINGLFADYKPYGREKYPKSVVGMGDIYKHASCKSCEESFSGWKRQRRCAKCIEAEGDIYPNWIVRDVRFSDNEAPAIKNRGGIIVKIERPGVERGSHASETSMDGWEFDYIIQNDGTFEELFVIAGKFCHDLSLI